MSLYSEDIKKLNKREGIPFIIVLCSVVYLVSYLARLSFSAATVEMISAEGYSKTLISIPLTALSVAYGLGQLLSGYLGDKISPEKMIFTGLLISSAMNLAIPFTPSITLMTAIWCINGFAQAMMWPPIVKILSTYFSPARYRKYIVFIGYGSSVGTIIIYLFAPLAISLSGWKTVFFFASAFCLVFSVVWIKNIYKAEKNLNGDLSVGTASCDAANKKPFHKFAVFLLSLIVLSVAMQGILRDGIATWMPTYITEVFKVESTVSILTGVALPTFSIFIMWFSAFIFRKYIANESLCAALFFGICGLSVGVLCIAQNKSAVLSVLMLMVANAATHGVNLMYTSMVVPNFAPYGKTSLVTGVINSATYVGSAVSTYGVALISDLFGWTGTIISWFIVSVAGAVLSLLSVISLNRLKRLNNKIK